MKTYNIQTAREIELASRESQEISRLAERRPERMLYGLADDQMSFVSEGYFDPVNLHSYWLDLGSAKNIDIIASRENKTLDRELREIGHDLVKGGFQHVGVLERRKVQDQENSPAIGFVRILYRTKPNGAVQEGYILCDLNFSSSIRRRFEAEVEAFEDAPHELMGQPGYLMRDDIFLD